MANPMLNDKRLQQAATSDEAGWAAPDAASRATIDDGPISPWNPGVRTMTIGGTVSATAVLFVLLLASAAVG